MKCSWHAHSVVMIETINDYTLIIDPFINGNTACDLEADKVKVDYVLLTHAHNDHVGEAVEIAKNNNATIIAMVELADYLSQFGVETVGMNVGGTAFFPFGSVKMTPAWHSSSYNEEDGTNVPLGLAGGFVIDDGASKVYHAGDTALFSDMSLIGPVDAAFIPIGDHYTMGICDAVKAAELLKPQLVIPIHYNTFPIIEQNPYDFINRLDDDNGKVPEVGEIFDVN